MSQNAEVLYHLKKGWTITAAEALREYDCFRLAARIMELKDAGWPIWSVRIKTASGKHVAQYSLNPNKEAWPE